VTIHTTHGDLKCEIFCELVPIAAKNFLALAAKGVYDDTVFHRNIRGISLRQIIKNRVYHTRGRPDRHRERRRKYLWRRI